LNQRRITLKDIAEQLGISKTAVSLALRKHHSISQKRQEQVQRLAEKMGYRPDPFLAGLSAYRQSNRPAKIQSSIAWINHWEQPERLRGRHREFEAYWKGAVSAAERIGYHLDEIRWPADCSAKRFEQILNARGVQGVLIPPHGTQPDWGDFDWGKFSIVRFGLSVTSPDTNLVTSDQFRAVIMAATKIYQYGYRRIGLVAGDSLDRAVGGNYYGAFCWAQDQLKLKPALPPLRTIDFARASIDQARSSVHWTRQKEVLRKWLARHEPDAILTTDSETPAMLQELGVRIPRDLAVAGTSVLDLPLDTGIDQHSEAIGRIAVETLVKQINFAERGEPADPYRILVESRWQDGKSLPPRRPQ
jgi:LacI family transcriptional regulator